MKNLMNEALKIMATKVSYIKGWTMLCALVLAAGLFSPRPVAAHPAGAGQRHQAILVEALDGLDDLRVPAKKTSNLKRQVMPLGRL